MFINIDKSMIPDKSKVLDKFDLLVYCYTMFKSLDDEKGYYIFNTDSQLERMNIKINERNWVIIDKAIKNLEGMCKLFLYDYERDSYAIGTLGYEPDMFYFRLYKHEFNLLIDKTKSLSENSTILHYYCWLLSRLNLKTQTFSMSYNFIHEGYGKSDKTTKKYNEKLVALGLISVSTEYKEGMNSCNFYKRIYVEETKVSEPADMDYIEEKITEDIEIKHSTYVNAEADAVIEKIDCNLAKQGTFYLCSEDLTNNDFFEINRGYMSIEKFLLQYREKFNGKSSDLAVKEMKRHEIIPITLEEHKCNVEDLYDMTLEDINNELIFADS